MDSTTSLGAVIECSVTMVGTHRQPLRRRTLSPTLEPLGPRGTEPKTLTFHPEWNQPNFISRHLGRKRKRLARAKPRLPFGLFYDATMGVSVPGFRSREMPRQHPG